MQIEFRKQPFKIKQYKYKRLMGAKDSLQKKRNAPYLVLGTKAIL